MQQQVRQQRQYSVLGRGGVFGMLLGQEGVPVGCFPSPAYGAATTAKGEREPVDSSAPERAKAASEYIRVY